MSEGILGQATEVNGDEELHASLSKICSKCGYPGGVGEKSKTCVKCQDSKGVKQMVSA